MGLREPLDFIEDSPWRVMHTHIGLSHTFDYPFYREHPTIFLVSILPDEHLTSDLQDPSSKVWVLLRSSLLAQSSGMMLNYYFITNGEGYYPICPFVSLKNHLPYKISDTAELWEIRLDVKDQSDIMELIQSAVTDDFANNIKNIPLKQNSQKGSSNGHNKS